MPPFVSNLVVVLQAVAERERNVLKREVELEAKSDLLLQQEQVQDCVSFSQRVFSRSSFIVPLMLTCICRRFLLELSIFLFLQTRLPGIGFETGKLGGDGDRPSSRQGSSSPQ